MGHGQHSRVVDGAVLEGAAVVGHEQATAWSSEAEEQLTVVFDDVPRTFVEAVHVEFLARGIVQPEGGFEEVKVLDVVDRGGGQQVLTDHTLQVSTAFQRTRPAFFAGGEVKHDHVQARGQRQRVAPWRHSHHPIGRRRCPEQLALLVPALDASVPASGDEPPVGKEVNRRDGLVEMAHHPREVPQVHDASTGRFRHQPWGSLRLLDGGRIRPASGRRCFANPEHATPGRGQAQRCASAPPRSMPCACPCRPLAQEQHAMRDGRCAAASGRTRRR